MVDLTVVILTKNEEKNLKKCIESFNRIVKRFVVVDSYSTDNTVDLAKSLDADVFQHIFENHAAQFNWCLNNVNITTSWTMKIDADEELTPELVDELKNKLDKLPLDVNGIILRRRVYFMGKWLRHGGKYPELLLRIFRTGYGMSEIKMMDEHLVIQEGKIVTFNNDILDNNNKDLEWWIGKHNWYSNKEVLEYQLKENKGNTEEMLSKNITSFQAKMKRFIKNCEYYSLPRFFRAHIYFIYRYYFCLGFLDGTEGKIYTFLQAYWYRFLVDAKMFECENTGHKMKEQGELRF
jgi:glycosyltransferase involved in cell wall biosynthesis